MQQVIQYRNYEKVELREREILRYAHADQCSDETMDIMKECLRECDGIFAYSVCYARFKVRCENDTVRLLAMSSAADAATERRDTEAAIKESAGTYDEIVCFESANLVKNLSGCDEALMMAATAGIGVDRLINKYARLSPMKALFIHAIGAEAVEALCDKFVSDYEKDNKVSTAPRFSPGYGDLNLSVQRSFERILDLGRRPGITLNENLLMTPSKSVTAIMGIRR